MSIQYFNFIRQVRLIDLDYQLSSREVLLLDYVAEAYFCGRPTFITELTHQRQIAAKGTLVKVLRELELKQMLLIEQNRTDARKKIVSLTKEALVRYDKLGRVFNRSRVRTWAAYPKAS